MKKTKCEIHLHVWSYPTDDRINNQNEKNLDFKIIGNYLVGYQEKFKRYRFYCLTHNTRIVDTSNARFVENGKICELVINHTI